MREHLEKRKLKVGFEGQSREVEVEVPENDAPAWDLDTKTRVVGTHVPRVDARAKVTGAAKYSYDINQPGLLHAKILRCPHPKAKLTRLDLSAALKVPGVVAAMEEKKPGQNCRFAGDEIAAVAAETLDAAQDGLDAIVVEYEPVAQFNTDFLMSPDAPRRDKDGNVIPPERAEKQAELDAACGEAAAVRACTYQTQCQTHSALETHGCTAWFKDGKLKVWASTQGTFAIHPDLAATLQMPAADVEVSSEFIGGGFGAKFNAGPEMKLACKLSRETGRPVKLMLSRKEEHIAVGNRPETIQYIKAAVSKEGAITAWDHWAWGNAGYVGRGAGVTTPDWYLGKAVRRRGGGDIQTDLDAQRAFRAPGHPQGFFAAESMMDELAEAIGMDPLEFRVKNDASAARRREFGLGAERIGWKANRNVAPAAERLAQGRLVRGVGCAAASWGGAGGARGAALCRIHPDGSVEIRNGGQDIGSGMKTVMAILTAEELGLPPARIQAFMGSTRDPFGPPSGGSTTTPSLAPAVRHAAWLARQELLALVAAHWGVAAEQLDLVDGHAVTIAASGKGDGKKMPFAEACKLIKTAAIETNGNRFRNYRGDDVAARVAGAYFAHVEVDTARGNVRVLKLVGVQDCGRILSRTTAESQVLGAMIQGISYALHEDKIVDHNKGRMVNPNFSEYKISGPKDVQEMEVHFLDVATGHTNCGAMGLGEPPATAFPAAIANAVRNAIGVPVRALPITPDRVLAALARRSG